MVLGKEEDIMSDNVNHPNHYQTEGGLEVIDIIKSVLGDGFEPYCIGNVLKYISRYKKKNGLEDLKKARVYINYVIDYLESIVTIKKEIQYNVNDDEIEEDPF